uniref:Uncharacterized protein n=1 Tax=Lepeophtheirus salmonis TaxID=72036 RepID=A0A0K2VGA9_LEPSM
MITTITNLSLSQIKWIRRSPSCFGKRNRRIGTLGWKRIEKRVHQRRRKIVVLSHRKKKFVVSHRKRNLVVSLRRKSHQKRKLVVSHRRKNRLKRNLVVSHR